MHYINDFWKKKSRYAEIYIAETGDTARSPQVSRDSNSEGRSCEQVTNSG